MDFPSLTLIHLLLEVLVPLFSQMVSTSTHFRTRAECRGVSITLRTGTSKCRNPAFSTTSFEFHVVVIVEHLLRLNYQSNT